MRLRRFLLAFFLLTITYSLSPSPVLAIAPPQRVYMFDFFPLYRFIKYPYLPLNENQELNRDIIKQEIILDTRPKSCSIDCGDGGGSGDSETQACEGPVNLKLTHLGGSVTGASFDVVGQCSAKCPTDDDDNKPYRRVYGKGTCTYNQTPGNSDQGLATDYSKSKGTLYPKLQNRSDAYNNVPPTSVSSNENVLQYGRSVLTQNLITQLQRKLLVVWQAQQTKSASKNASDDGVWPLGGVDWLAPLNYQAGCKPSILNSNITTPPIGSNTIPTGDKECTIISVWQAMNGDSRGQSLQVLSGTLDYQWQDMVMASDNPRDVSSGLKQIDAIFQEVMNLPEAEQPAWYKLMAGVPECGPGYDRGYIFLSHCFPIFGQSVCTPIGPLETFVNGNPLFRAQGTYADPTARQALCSTVYEVYSMNTLENAREAMKEMKDHNPLLPYSLMANQQAWPKNIDKHLSASMNDPYKDYFNIFWFGKLIDGWRETVDKMHYLELGYNIRGNGGVSIRQGGAYEAAGTQNVFAYVLGTLSQTIDKAFQVTHHSVYVPPASAIVGFDVGTDYMTKTNHTLDNQKTYFNAETAKYSNSVQGTGGVDGNVGTGGSGKKFVGGWFMRNVEPYTSYPLICDSPIFSAFSPKNSIDDYVKGIRISCLQQKEENPNTGGYGYLCKGEVKPAGDNLHKLCGTEHPLSGVPISDGLKSIIESAASKYNVPASLILADMFGEGGFERGYPLDDAGIEEASMCKGGFKSCLEGTDGNSNSEGAKGPFQILPYWFKPEDGDRCNFYDAANWIAKQISQQVYGSTSWASCPGYALNSGSWSGKWTDQDILSAARGLRGMCHPEFFDRVLKTTHDYACWVSL